MKKCSTSLVIRKVQIKTIMRYYFTSDRMAINKKASVGKDMEKLEPLYVIGGNVKWCGHYGKQYRGFSKK